MSLTLSLSSCFTRPCDDQWQTECPIGKDLGQPSECNERHNSAASSGTPLSSFTPEFQCNLGFFLWTQPLNPIGETARYGAADGLYYRASARRRPGAWCAWLEREAGAGYPPRRKKQSDHLDGGAYWFVQAHKRPRDPYLGFWTAQRAKRVHPVKKRGRGRFRSVLPLPTLSFL